MSVTHVQPIVPTRRRFPKGTGQAVLSASAVALIVGGESMAANRQTASNPEGDVEILNIALGLEWEAIGAYQIGAESGLLEQPMLGVAVQFQGHHKTPADALAGA